MTISRYANLNKLEGKYYETANFPTSKELDAISYFYIRPTAMDRLDTLSFKYFGSDEYWWVIALVNDIDWAFDFVPGQQMRIPVDVNEVLKLF